VHELLAGSMRIRIIITKRCAMACRLNNSSLNHTAAEQSTEIRHTAERVSFSLFPCDVKRHAENHVVIGLIKISDAYVTDQD
jgi:hypothetical protein